MALKPQKLSDCLARQDQLTSQLGHTKYLFNYWYDLNKGRHVYTFSNFVYLIKFKKELNYLFGIIIIDCYSFPECYLQNEDCQMMSIFSSLPDEIALLCQLSCITL